MTWSVFVETQHAASNLLLSFPRRRESILIIWIPHQVQNDIIKNPQSLSDLEGLERFKLSKLSLRAQRGNLLKLGDCFDPRVIGGLAMTIIIYNPVSSTTAFTWSTVFFRAAFSSAVKSISRIFSIPSQPITHGTPIK